MKCQFTHNIAGQLECSKIPDFDDNGFAYEVCKQFPCEKYKMLIGKLEENKKYRKEILNNEI